MQLAFRPLASSLIPSLSPCRQSFSKNYTLWTRQGFLMLSDQTITAFWGQSDVQIRTFKLDYAHIVSENVSKGRSFRHSFSLRLMRLAFMNTSAYMDARWKDNSALSIGTYFLCFKSDLDRHLFDKMEGREVERVNYVIANQITACYPRILLWEPENFWKTRS